MVLFELPGLGSASGEGQLLVGRKANEITRQMDMIARLDQDRIGALMIDCNAFGAMVAAERFQVELAPILTDLGISLGAGIAAWRDWMTKPDDLLRAAEEALLSARSQGRIASRSTARRTGSDGRRGAARRRDSNAQRS